MFTQHYCKIFLSYARRDANIVHEVFSLISQHIRHLEVWYDKQDIVESKDWDLQILQGLETSTSLLLIASRYSFSSWNVKQEVDYFLHTGKPIYVVLIDDTPIDPDLGDYPIIDLRYDPFDEKRWYELLNAIRDNRVEQVDTGLKDVASPFYVRNFVSKLNRLNGFFFVLNLLFLGLAQLLPGNRASNLTFILTFVWIFDLSATLLLPGRMALRKLQDVNSMLVVGQGVLRVVTVTFFLSGILGGQVPEIGGQTAFLSWTSLLSFISFGLALGFIYLIYKQTFRGVLEFYPYSSKDIKKRLTKEETEATVSDYFLRFFSLRSMYHSKLAGWLPAYPIERSFRVQFQPRTGHYYNKNISKLEIGKSDTLTILYIDQDLPLASFLAERLHSARRSVHLTSEMNTSVDNGGTYVIVVTPYSIDAAEAFIEKNPHVPCIPVLMQKTKMRENIGRLQYIDGRSDYLQAARGIVEILEGKRQNNVTGEIEDRSRIQIPKSLAILFVPSVIILFISLLIPLLTLLIWLLPPESIFIQPDDVIPSFILLSVMALLIDVVPFQMIRNGMKRKYSLSTFALVNTLMMIPLVPLIFVSDSNIVIILAMILVMGSLIAIPPLITILLAWTNINFGDPFDVRVPPRVWSPHKGISWGILSYSVVIVGILVALGFAVSRDTMTEIDTDLADNISTDFSSRTYDGPIEVVDLIIGESHGQTSLGEIYLRGEATHFSQNNSLSGLLLIRYIENGDQAQFIWYHNGSLLAETEVYWQRSVDWTEPNNVAQLVADVNTLDSMNFLPGEYELVVTINGTYLTHTVFSITD